MGKQHRLTALLMLAIFELEFVPEAELYKTANYLRTLGIAATVVSEPKEMIVVEADSYTNAMEKLSPVVTKLPDIFKFSWRNGLEETVIFEATRDEPFLKDAEITDSLKVLRSSNGSARVTVVLKDDKNTVIKYQNVVRKIEKMGFKVTFAEGYMDAGWMQFPAIDIEIANNIAGFKDAIIKLSDISEVNRFLYNRGKNPIANDFTVTYENGADLELQIARFLANGIEVYKVDKLLNRLFIHFPQTEVQNKNKLEQVKAFDGLVVVKSLHENRSEYSKPEYAKNVRNVWINVPEDVLRAQWSGKEYEEALYQLARQEVARLVDKGMIVLHYGLYTEIGEALVPEIVFTYKNADSPKAEEIMKEYSADQNQFIKFVSSLKKKATSEQSRTCASLFR